MFQNLTFCTENFADTPSNLSIRGTKFFKTEAYLKKISAHDDDTRKKSQQTLIDWSPVGREFAEVTNSWKG